MTRHSPIKTDLPSGSLPGGGHGAVGQLTERERIAKRVKRFSATPKGCYAAVIYLGPDDDDNIVWRCHHEHPTMLGARACTREMLDAFDKLRTNGFWMRQADVLN